MKDIYIDVSLELDTLQLNSLPDPSRFVTERLREEADRKCDEANAQLRTDRPPEMIVKQAINPLTATPVTLVAARFAVIAPESLSMEPAR